MSDFGKILLNMVFFLLLLFFCCMSDYSYGLC